MRPARTGDPALGKFNDTESMAKLVDVPEEVAAGRLRTLAPNNPEPCAYSGEMAETESAKRL